MRRNIVSGRTVFLALLGCMALGFLAVKRDFLLFGDAPEFNKLETGIYSPPTIGNAIKFIADMNTYLYHEARCGHITEEEAAATEDKVTAGVRLDFPGWWLADTTSLKVKTWLAHRRINDISCSHATVENPTALLGNIGHYARRS